MTPNEEIVETAKLCIWSYKMGFDTAVECLKNASAINNEEKMLQFFTDVIQQKFTSQPREK